MMRLLAASELDLTRRDGSTTHLEMLVREIHGKGHEVVSVFPRFMGRAEVRMAGKTVRVPVPFQGKGRASRALALLDYQQSSRSFIPRLHKAKRFDAAYIREGIATHGVIAGAVKSGLPTIVEVNGIVSEELVASGLPRFTGKARDLFARPALLSADRIVTVSDGLRIRLAKRYGIPKKHIAVVPNGVDPSLFSPKDKNEARRALNLKEGQEMAVWAGYMAPWQDLGLLLEAWKRVAKRRNGLLLVVGGGPGEDELKRKASSMGLSENVRFLGRIPHANMPDVLNAADVAVAPFEKGRPCSPLKVYEYLSCGKPVVATNLADLAFVKSSGSGLLTAPDDPSAFADAVEAIFSDSTTSREMGRKGREEILARHTWSSVAERVLGVVSEAVQAKENRSR